jgi:hypothetical protein
MRHILTSLVFVVLLFPALALGEEVAFYDLIKNDSNGLYYKKFTDVPFTEKVTGSEQGKMKKGKEEGPWVSYKSDGTVNEKDTGSYENDVKVG